MFSGALSGAPEWVFRLPLRRRFRFAGLLRLLSRTCLSENRLLLSQPPGTSRMSGNDCACLADDIALSLLISERAKPSIYGYHPRSLYPRHRQRNKNGASALSLDNHPLPFLVHDHSILSNQSSITSHQSSSLFVLDARPSIARKSGTKTKTGQWAGFLQKIFS